MTNSTHRASPVTLALALAILLGGVSLPSVASAQTTEERLKALEDAVAKKKGEIAELEGQLQVLKRDLALPTGPSPVVKAAPLTSDKPENCDIVGKSPHKIMAAVNDFQAKCLGFDEWKDYDTADLNVQLSGSTDDAAIEIVPSYTFRWGLPQNPRRDGRFRTSYLTLKAGVRANLDEGKKTSTFADLSTFSSSPGLTGILGFEYGLSARKPYEHFRKGIAKGLIQARKECLAEFAATPVYDPLEFKPDSEERNIVVRPHSDVAAACEGKELSDWMADDERRSGYSTAIVQPLWGVKATSVFFFGAEARYGKPEYKFFPLVDPANTGEPLLSGLPAAFPEGETKRKESVYSIKAYAGTGFDDFGRAKIDGDISASIAYRREFAYPGGTGDQQVCANTAAPYLTCHKKNISAPYELDGWVLGARLAFEAPRIGFFPSLGMEFKGTYALDVDQWGFQVPFYFVPDDKGKTQGGIVVGCTTAGETRNGYPLEKDCRASLFIGTEFGLRKR